MSLGLLNQYSAEESKKLAVWAKGHTVPGLDRSMWCNDDNGTRIKYSDYGDKNSPYGWEMDHYPIPKVLGGRDEISNLRPLHCFSNASHGGILGSLLSR